MSDLTKQEVNQQVRAYLDLKEKELLGRFEERLVSVVSASITRYSEEIGQLRSAANFLDHVEFLDLVEIIRNGGKIVVTKDFQVDYDEETLQINVGSKSIMGFRECTLNKGKCRLTILVEQVKTDG